MLTEMGMEFDGKLDYAVMGIYNIINSYHSRKVIVCVNKRYIFYMTLLT